MNNYVYTIAVQMDGKILVGGVFTRVGGQTRNSIARLDPTTGLVDSFNPNANHIVDEIAVQPDGRILVGGYFNNIGGQTRFHLARLDPATGMADSFNPNPNNFINTIALQTDGKILVGGRFISIGGQSRNNIARLDPRPDWLTRSTPTRLLGPLTHLLLRRWRPARHLRPFHKRLPLLRWHQHHSQMSWRSRCSQMARFWPAAISPNSRRTGERQWCAIVSPV